MERRIIPSILLVCCWIAAVSDSFPAMGSYSTATVDIRGKPQALSVYDPAPGAPRRPVQVIVTSGDVGWIGLPVDIAEHMRELGYRTIGFNARAYLSSFTGKDTYLHESDIPGDYRTILDWAASHGSAPGEFVMIGTSEGAGLSVIGMGHEKPDPRCRGLVALGLPMHTSLGWRWSDFTMWITKKDPKEPQAETRKALLAMRIPLVMIHSMHDEWDSVDKARELWGQYPGPKKFFPVNAVNHRFSDKLAEVMGLLDKSMAWLQNPALD